MSDVIPIQIIEGNVEKGLEEMFTAEKFNWKCPKCDSLEATKILEILQEPPTLILQLMRFKFDLTTKEIIKIHDPVFCPQSLLMPSGTTYTLNSSINHIGQNAKSGHYHLVLYDRSNDKLVLLDDMEISHVFDMYHEIGELCYMLTYINKNEMTLL